MSLKMRQGFNVLIKPHIWDCEPEHFLTLFLIFCGLIHLNLFIVHAFYWAFIKVGLMCTAPSIADSSFKPSTLSVKLY